MTFRQILCSFALAASFAATASAEPIPVKEPQGSMRGFLVIRSATGTIIGHAEYYQLVAGDRITAHLTLKFRDGSLDDETTVYLQRKTFQFVSDHHIQRGPFFKNAMDMQLEANGDLTLKTTDKDGKEKVETNHIDLPPDISNGMVGNLMQNVSHDTAPFTVGMVLPSGKGRLAKLAISPDGTQPFTAVTGDRLTANIFRVKIELGGVAGVVAPIIGKQPSDVILWVAQGEVPLLVREQAQLSEGGPTISLELGGTSFSRGGK
jgi:hypothetical protein